MRKIGLMTAAAMAATMVGAAAHAASLIYIDDSNGKIGTVNISTGAVDVIGSSGVALTDIGFTKSGELYGVSFSDLYTINKTTGAASHVSSETGSLSALVGSNTGGLYAAGYYNNSLYSIDPKTGAETTLNGSTGTPSYGDLAYFNGNLYDAGRSSTNGSTLYKLNVSNNTVSGQFVGNMTAKGTTIPPVYGLASDGSSLYAIAGTEIYSVNANNGNLTPLLDYSGHGLGVAYGSAFLNEATVSAAPEPGVWALMLAGVAMIGLTLRQGRRQRGMALAA